MAMGSKDRTWLTISVIAIALAGCSKSPSKETREGHGSSDDAFGSFQSKITRDTADSTSRPPPTASVAPSAASRRDSMEGKPIAPSRAGAEGARDTTVTETHETSVAGIVRTRTTRTTNERVAVPMNTLPPIVERWIPTPIPPSREQPPVQSGLLTAGDYDDLLNPRAYASYASTVLQQAGGSLPFVDTRSRISIKVVGSDGRPVPFAKVSVPRKGRPLVLTSTADGVVSFYPGFDKVGGKVSVAVASPTGNANAVVDVDRGPQNLALALKGTPRLVAALDIALVIDTTGSMGDEIRYLQAELDSIVTRIKRNAGNIDIRIGLVAYRDIGDEYVVKSLEFAGGNTARNALAALDAGGGGDMPEAMDQAIGAAARLKWRPDAVKVMLLVADAPPHEEKLQATLATTTQLRSMGVQIVPVAASGVDDTAQYVMRTMSAMTQGRYLFLTDDSGVGNPHAEPMVGCYLVTRLDGLVARVIAGFVTGRRVEPRQEDVIREVGQYNRGRCAGEDGVAGQE